MRELSTRLELLPETTVDKFFAVIEKWLKSEPDFNSDLGEQLEASDKKSGSKLYGKYASIDLLRGKRDGERYIALLHKHKYFEQDWETDIVYRELNDRKEVVFHIDCFGDTTQYELLPMCRTDVIREFAKSGLVKQERLPLQNYPIRTSDDLMQFMIDAMNGKYTLDLPMIFATRMMGSMGYEVNTEEMARRLFGIAYVVEEDSPEFSYVIKDKVKGKNPFNGYVGTYFSNSAKPKVSRRTEYKIDSLDKEVLTDLYRTITAQTDAVTPSWKSLKGEEMIGQANEQGRLLNAYEDENGSLESRLKLAEERIADLMQENRELRSQNESYRAALENGEEKRILISSSMPEFFDGEQYDLVVSTLQMALKNHLPNSRAAELLQSIIDVNPIKGEGLKINETIKVIFSSVDGELRDRDYAALKQIGFELVSDNPHKKFVYKGNDKYYFTYASTPSDYRSGKNTASDILKKISVYKK